MKEPCIANGQAGVITQRRAGPCHFTVQAGGIVTIGDQSLDRKDGKLDIVKQVTTIGQHHDDQLNSRSDRQNGNATCSSSSGASSRFPKQSAAEHPGETHDLDTLAHVSSIVTGRPRNAHNVPNIQLPTPREEIEAASSPDTVLGKRAYPLGSTPAASTRSAKRKRDNWTESENLRFIKTVIDNSHLEEMDLRRLLAKSFSPRRTHEQCANHLRILRAQGKLPQAKEDAQKGS